MVNTVVILALCPGAQLQSSCACTRGAGTKAQSINEGTVAIKRKMQAKRTGAVMVPFIGAVWVPCCRPCRLAIQAIYPGCPELLN